MWTCIYSLYSCIIIHIFVISLKNVVATWQIWAQSHYAKWEHWLNIFAYVCKNTINCNMYNTCYFHVCVSNKYASQMLHICHTCKLVHVQIWDNCASTCLIWTHCNQLCEQKHWHAYISHYWHMPPKKYACHTAYVSPTALLL